MVFDRDHWRALATELRITYDCRIDTEDLRAMVEDKLTRILAAGRIQGTLFSGSGYMGLVYRDIGTGSSTQDDSECKFGTVVYDWRYRTVATIGDVRSAAGKRSDGDEEQRAVEGAASKVGILGDGRRPRSSASSGNALAARTAADLQARGLMHAAAHIREEASEGPHCAEDEEECKFGTVVATIGDVRSAAGKKRSDDGDEERAVEGAASSSAASSKVARR